MADASPYRSDDHLHPVDQKSRYPSAETLSCDYLHHHQLPDVHLAVGVLQRDITREVAHLERNSHLLCGCEVHTNFRVSYQANQHHQGVHDVLLPEPCVLHRTLQLLSLEAVHPPAGVVADSTDHPQHYSGVEARVLS